MAGTVWRVATAMIGCTVKEIGTISLAARATMLSMVVMTMAVGLS
jgi:hypothetical protein